MKKPEKIRKKIILLCLLVFTITGLSAQVKKDTTKIVNDSLLISKTDSAVTQVNDSIKTRIIDSIRKLLPDSTFIRNLTDSLQTLYYQDSLRQAYLIDSMEYLYDSLKFEIYTDSLIRVRDDSIRHSFNKSAREDLMDPILMVDEDSVRNSLNDLSTYIFSDSITNMYPDSLKRIMDRLVGHLAKDSTNIWLINNERDTTLLKLNKYKSDSVFVWLQNSLMDSAKIYIQTLDKYSVRMWVDDDIFLKQLWKKQIAIDLFNHENQFYNNYHPKKIKPVPFPKDPWSWWGNANLHIAQGVVSNWATGGESSISAKTIIEAFCNYTKDKSHWENKLEFQYGILKSGNYRSFRKNQDKFELNSKFGQKAFKFWHYSAYANLKTQIFKGYNYPNDSVPVSKLLAPAYFEFGIGMDYKPNKKLSVLMAPLGAKMTLVVDTVQINHVSYGLANDEKLKKEMGAKVTVIYKSTILKNVVFENKMNLFTNYMHNPQNIDIDWQVKFIMKVNRYISARLESRLIYDDDILVPLYDKVDGIKTKMGMGKRIQFKEYLTIGFSYAF